MIDRNETGEESRFLRHVIERVNELHKKMSEPAVESILYEASNHGFTLQQERVDQILKNRTIPTVFEITGICLALGGRVDYVLTGENVVENMELALEETLDILPAEIESGSPSKGSEYVEIADKLLSLSESQRERILILIDTLLAGSK